MGEGKRVFDNVPERLSNYIQQTPLELYNSRRELVYLNAASGVIGEYLHKNFFDPAATDPFLIKRKINEAGDFSFGFPQRVLLIGSTLFEMRRCKGFPEFCRRLQSRNLRATFFEMLAAKQFMRAGFEIHAKAETGVRGQDFDFWAIRDSEWINVEVTALEGNQYALKTILNALEQKRKQLPKYGASVIFCAIPEQWDGGSIDLNFATMFAAFKFFARQLRVNAIVFCVERHRNIGPDGSKGVFMLLKRTYAHPSPRTPQNIDFLFEELPLSDVLKAAFREPAKLANSPDKVDALAAEVRTTEFFKWVDYLVPRPPPAHGAL
jgi:hypothetical protein